MDSPALHEALRRLAANHRWAWTASCGRLLLSLPGATPDRHPVETVAALTPGQLDDLLADDEFMTHLADEIADLDTILEGVGDPQIAYLSPEFGISSLVPQYSGGLGILAGDHLKASSDRRLPLVAVGLFYGQGYFRQVIDEGRQTEAYLDLDPEDFGAEDTGQLVRVPFPGREVTARIWRMEIGVVPLLLLDTNVETNAPDDRSITDRLYGGDRRHRLDQEMMLGIGGARALASLGYEVTVHHLNEGHAGFIILELIDRVIEEGDLRTAIDRVRPGLVFTTHTPVPAGIDRFTRDLIAPYLECWAGRWEVPAEEVWSLGEDPDDGNQFNMAALTLRASSSANGVSKLHGKVSRHLFAGVGCGDHIFSITNGVHARTWVSTDSQDVFDRTLGPTWANGDPDAWDRVSLIDDEGLTALRRRGSLRLAELIGSRVGASMDPDALILGFARRFAPYKRATLLLNDDERLQRLLSDDDRPVHFVFAGKAHPHDAWGKNLVADIVEYSSSPASNLRFTFIPAYDMEVARALVAGCDIWLNNPIRPREASGTSGEKAALNGGLNCSILDGWWAEMYDGENGWAIAASDETEPGMRDSIEASSMLDTIMAIRSEYHDQPPRFLNRIRHAWRTLGPRVTAGRMLEEYVDRVYQPALARSRDLAAEDHS